MKAINFNKVTLQDSLYTKRIEVLNDVTIWHSIEKLYSTNRVQNFINAAKKINGESVQAFKGITFDDTDLYKLIEGGGYLLAHKFDPKLDDELDKLITVIGNAQEADGYITTRHTIHPEEKWTCMDAHELYNFGHLIEGALAHHYGTNKTNFLEIAIKAANYLCEFFKDENKWVPGHQEIELALFKLHQLTNEQKYYDLACAFLDNRGKGLGQPNKDYSIFTENPIYLGIWDTPYHQDTVPLEFIHKVEGHSVRAMYMYTAMAMRNKENNLYTNSLNAVWDNLVTRNMYITGGIGSSKFNEGWQHDYCLPNSSSYCESCASIGMVYWNHEMLMQDYQSKYISVIERELKNGAISGLSSCGTKFFYDNPLASDGSANRKEWFDCSCCPTQLIRFIPSIGKYLYAIDEQKFYINLAISSEYNDNDQTLKLTKDDSTIRISHNLSKDISFKVPNDSHIESVSVPYTIENGFIVISQNHMQFEIKLGQGITFKHANGNVANNANQVSISYDGFVYCLEECDAKEFDTFIIEEGYTYTIEKGELSNTEFKFINVFDSNGEKLASLIPYFLWNNRGSGKMRVWLKNNIRELYYN